MTRLKFSSRVSVTKHAKDITKTRPYDIQQFFTVVKKDDFQMKHCDIFLIFAQNIDCGYTLDPPQSKNKKIMYTPVNPSVTI